MVWPQWTERSLIKFEIVMQVPGVGFASTRNNPIDFESEEEWGAAEFGVTPEVYSAWNEWAKGGCQCQAFYKNGNRCRERIICDPSEFNPETSIYCDRHKAPTKRGKPKNEDRAGFVYLIEAVGTNRFKVGLSIRPIQRGQSLAKQSPFPLNVLAVHKTSDRHKTEQYFHQIFKGSRIHGEWFELSESQINLFMAWNESGEVA